MHCSRLLLVCVCDANRLKKHSVCGCTQYTHIVKIIFIPLFSLASSDVTLHKQYIFHYISNILRM